MEVEPFGFEIDEPEALNLNDWCVDESGTFAGRFLQDGRSITITPDANEFLVYVAGNDGSYPATDKKDALDIANRVADEEGGWLK